MKDRGKQVHEEREREQGVVPNDATTTNDSK
jgi:hypothetical protein